MQALIVALMVPLMLLNVFGGIVSGIWLAILGQWWAIGIGLVAIFVHALVVPVMGAGVTLMMLTTAATAARGGVALASPFILVTQLLIYGIVAAWSIAAFHIFMSKADYQTHLPLLIWSYGVAVGPWAALTARDRQSGSGGASTIASFFLQIAYVVTGLVVIFAHTTTPIMWLQIFLAIMLVGALLQTALAVIGMIPPCAESLPADELGAAMWGFFKKREMVELEVPTETGIRKIKVSQAQLDKWQAEGKIGPPMPTCRVHMLGLSAFKPVIENWTIGKNISRETYDKFKDANGDIYATEFREDGETKTHVLRKDKWEELRRRLEALG